MPNPVDKLLREVDAVEVTPFTLNGHRVQVGEHEHLLAALRDELGILSVKDGCSPSGQCGCCVVHIDGKAVVSCQQPLDKIEGKRNFALVGPSGSLDITRFGDIDNAVFGRFRFDAEGRPYSHGSDITAQ